MNDTDRPQIVIAGDDPMHLATSAHLERLRQYGDVKLHTDRPNSADEQVRRAENANVLMNSRTSVKWPDAVLRRLPKLKLFVSCGIGTDAVDVEAARRLGIAVSNVPGKTAPVVAEHALGLMMAAAKRAVFQTAELKAGRWTHRDNIYLSGKTLGVVGTGSIGAAVARLGRAIGMRTVAWTFHPSAERGRELGVEYVELDELLRISDVVSLHLRLTDDSRHLIARRELALMKPRAILVNTARGDVIDTKALVDALKSNHLGAAALDVFDVEPLPGGHPLLECDQVVLTPHNADQTPEGCDLLNGGAVDNVVAFLSGKPQNVVN
jgi:D-3-phosphoglycerate dehydrogenase